MKQSPSLTVNKIKWLSFCFFTSCAPHFLHLPIWISVFIISAVIWRLRISATGGSIPGLLLRFILISLAIAMVYFYYGTLFGRDAGIAFLSLMLAFKLLEMKSHRDVLLFLILNYFVIVTHFLYNQNIIFAIFMIVAVCFVTTTIVHVNQLTEQRGITKDLKLALTLLLQSLPVMIILFVLFPRIDTTLWKKPDQSMTGATGLSDNMTPGDISQLIKNKKIAFRVKFDKHAPEKKQLYWRGPVLSLFDGRSWSAHTPIPIKMESYRLQGQSYHYTITLEANGKKYLPTLDFPATAPANAYLSTEYSAYNNNIINTRKDYRVFSRTHNISILADNDARAHYTQLPESHNPKTKQYIQTLSQQVHSQQQLVNLILKKFNVDNYHYTLQPPVLGKHSVDDFLFNSRRGFCEHYASAFVVMMRFAGIPARVVTGYQGGEYNPVGNYYIVRSSDAHAWAEIKLNGQAWHRVDPTAFIAPERIERGIDASLANEQNWQFSQFTSKAWLGKFALYWDAFNNSFNRWILGYGQQVQNRLISLFGFNDANWQDLVATLVVLVVLVIIVLFLYYNLGFLYKKRNPVETLYQVFCKKLATVGLARYHWEGPEAYKQRIIHSKKIPPERINAIIEIYIQLRYQKPTNHKLLPEFRVLVKNFKL